MVIVDLVVEALVESAVNVKITQQESMIKILYFSASRFKK